jgi:hypothetical protein
VYLGLRKQTYAWGTRRTERSPDIAMADVAAEDVAVEV